MTVASGKKALFDKEALMLNWSTVLRFILLTSANCKTSLSTFFLLKADVTDKSSKIFVIFILLHFCS